MNRDDPTIAPSTTPTTTPMPNPIIVVQNVCQAWPAIGPKYWKIAISRSRSASA